MRRGIARIAALVAIVAVVLVALVMSPAWRVSGRAASPNAVQIAADIESFRQRYGPNHYSEHAEEWMIRDHFQDRRGGVFVDVGANHYRRASKTYYLESVLGWSGVAVEPQREFAAGYANYRPRTKFAPFFVSDVSNETARLFMIKNMGLVASSNEAFVKTFGTADEVRDVPTITLNDLLDAENIQHIDFLSMDIELHEPQALKGFDIARFKPSLVCIEALLPVRQQILDYFAAHRYVAIGKYLWVDTENLYFVPLESAPAAAP
ncbi:MAG: FkbM family methyltransferase [Acidobacteriota bacterium]